MSPTWDAEAGTGLGALHSTTGAGAAWDTASAGALYSTTGRIPGLKASIQIAEMASLVKEPEKQESKHQGDRMGTAEGKGGWVEGGMTHVWM